VLILLYFCRGREAVREAGRSRGRLAAPPYPPPPFLSGLRPGFFCFLLLLFLFVLIVFIDFLLFLIVFNCFFAVFISFICF